jgi:glyoxylase-like metal-dependent hydrolase (beta-lactamase superfamily II)
MTPTQPQRSLSRRRFLQLAAAAGASALAGFGGSLLWADQAVRQFANHTVTPLTPWLVNTYLLRGERSVLVDAGFPADAAAIREALARYSLLPHDLALLFITHGHYDHFGSAAALQSGSAVPVSIHPAEADRLIAGVTTPVEVLTTTGYVISALPTDARPAVPVTPTVLLAGGETLRAYGVNAQVLHTPGHTAGSLSLLIDGMAIIGDLLAGSLLYPNQPDYPFFIDAQADQPHILSSLRRLLDAGAHTFFPGHGLPFDRAAAANWLAAQEQG